MLKYDVLCIGGGLDDGDVLAEELSFEEGMAHSHGGANSRGAGRKLLFGDEFQEGDIDAAQTESRGVDTSRHFSYYAFEGKTGALRWKHEVCF